MLFTLTVIRTDGRRIEKKGIAKLAIRELLDAPLELGSLQSLHIEREVN